MKRNYIRKLTKSGRYSYYVILPKNFIDELNWRERQKMVVSLRGKKITIQDFEPKKKLRK